MEQNSTDELNLFIFILSDSSQKKTQYLCVNFLSVISVFFCNLSNSTDNIARQKQRDLEPKVGKISIEAA
ncbi:hypothetical protein [Planktothrix sp.]|uniref:hypothetical protein n=1 Tax=Planktothrix sp. TaxID=3088171 RepID=UPI0038D4F9A3